MRGRFAAGMPCVVVLLGHTHTFVRRFRRLLVLPHQPSVLCLVAGLVVPRSVSVGHVLIFSCVIFQGRVHALPAHVALKPTVILPSCAT